MPGKALLRLIPTLALFAALGGACTADVEESGSLPDVDVEGGRAPEVDVNPADVDVTTDTQQVVVPNVDVNAPADTVM